MPIRIIITTNTHAITLVEKFPESSVVKAKGSPNPTARNRPTIIKQPIRVAFLSSLMIQG